MQSGKYCKKLCAGVNILVEKNDVMVKYSELSRIKMFADTFYNPFTDFIQ